MQMVQQAIKITAVPGIDQNFLGRIANGAYIEIGRALVNLGLNNRDKISDGHCDKIKSCEGNEGGVNLPTVPDWHKIPQSK